MVYEKIYLDGWIKMLGSKITYGKRSGTRKRTKIPAHLSGENDFAVKFLNNKLTAKELNALMVFSRLLNSESRDLTKSLIRKYKIKHVYNVRAKNPAKNYHAYRFSNYKIKDYLFKPEIEFYSRGKLKAILYDTKK